MPTASEALYFKRASPSKRPSSQWQLRDRENGGGSRPALSAIDDAKGPADKEDTSPGAFLQGISI